MIGSCLVNRAGLFCYGLAHKPIDYKPNKSKYMGNFFFEFLIREYIESTNNLKDI